MIGVTEVDAAACLAACLFRVGSLLELVWFLSILRWERQRCLGLKRLSSSGLDLGRSCSAGPRGRRANSNAVETGPSHDHGGHALGSCGCCPEEREPRGAGAVSADLCSLRHPRRHARSVSSGHGWLHVGAPVGLLTGSPFYCVAHVHRHIWVFLSRARLL